MEEYIKDRAEEKQPEPTIRPGGQGLRVTPVSPPPSFKPTTPIPKVSAPLPPFTPAPGPIHKGKKDIMTFFLLLAVIFIAFSLWALISIGFDNIPGFFS